VHPLGTVIPVDLFPQRALPEFHYQGNEITEFYQFDLKLQSSKKTDQTTYYRRKRDTEDLSTDHWFYTTINQKRHHQYRERQQKLPEED
jgi:hypothetical protein